MSASGVCRTLQVPSPAAAVSGRGHSDPMDGLTFIAMLNRDAEGLITWEVNVDTTIARAHQHAAGARKGGTGNAKNRAESTPSRPTTAWGVPEAG